MQNPQPVHTLIDTGFTGELTVPVQVAKDLGLEVVGVEEITYGDGSIQSTPVSLAVAALADGTKKGNRSRG